MRFNTIAYVFSAVFLLMPWAGQATDESGKIGTLTVAAQEAGKPNTPGTFTVSGWVVYPKTGTIYVDLLNAGEYKNNQKGEHHLVLIPDATDPKNQKMEFKFENVRPGDYVIECYQDVNGNGKLDWNLVHPSEPVIMYRKAWPFMGMPGFDSVKFPVQADTKNIELKL